MMTVMAGDCSVKVAGNAGFTVPSTKTFRQIYYLFA